MVGVGEIKSLASRIDKTLEPTLSPISLTQHNPALHLPFPIPNAQITAEHTTLLQKNSEQFTQTLTNPTSLANPSDSSSQNTTTDERSTTELSNSVNPSGSTDPSSAATNPHGLTPEQLAGGRASVHGARLAAGGDLRLCPPKPNVPQNPKTAAFFDLDNTIIKGASTLWLALGLASRRFFSLRDVAGFAWKQAKFILSGTESQPDIDSGQAQALEIVRGRSEAEVVALTEEIWEDTIAERIFPGAKELAEQHLDAGHSVWLVTAAPVQLAQVIARHLGFTGALGTVAEVKDGRFTGRLVGGILHGPEKRDAVAALAEQQGLELADCVAYSDSFNDMPLLSLVGRAVAVNADPRLAEAAQERGWLTVEYRKHDPKRTLRAAEAGATAAGVLAAGALGWLVVPTLAAAFARR